jgi:AAA domain
VKIIRFEAENFKRLKAVEITPDEAGNLVIIAGRNGAGKTSVLDAIWMALGGGQAAKGTPQPVRDGEDSAHVTLDLGDIVVTRRWRADGKTSLKVSAADGASYSSPQVMLDGLVQRMAFDPLTFSRLAPKDQLAQLLQLVELPFDPAQLAAKRKGIYDERTDVGRQLRAAQARLADAPAVPDGTPEEEVSAADVLAELEAARAEAAENERKRAAVAEYQREVEETSLASLAAHEALQAAQLKLHDAERAEKAAREKYAKGQEIIAALPADPDLSSFSARLQSLEQTNAHVRAAKARHALAEEVAKLGTNVDALTARLEQLDQSKADALGEAAMPIEGLAFDDDGVTYRGVPFSQCSAAEQLRVSVAMAMALSPEVRVIRITDGSLLDSGSMRLIEEMAAEHDYQIWIEVVDESGDVGVVIEDGATAPVPVPA